MPNLFIRERRVVRFILRRAAAPSVPPTRPLHAVSACTFSWRCFLAYSSETLLLSLRECVLSPATCLTSHRLSGDLSVCVFRSSGRGASSDLPRVRRDRKSV